MSKEKEIFFEARRVRYFYYLCEQIKYFTTIDIDFLIKYILTETKRLNELLPHHKRITGVMRTPFVASNYIGFCRWLNLADINVNYISRNGYTLFLSSIGQNYSFFLNTSEKVAFFLLIVKHDSVVEILRSLKQENSFNDFVKQGYSDHLVESIIEWFVDLDILIPTKKVRGRFLHDISDYSLSPDNLIVTYLSKFTEKNIQEVKEIEQQLFLSYLENIRILQKGYATNELDPSNYHAIPVLLGIQLKLIIEKGVYITLGNLVHHINTNKTYHDLFDFKVDTKIEKGYFKFYI